LKAENLKSTKKDIFMENQTRRKEYYCQKGQCLAYAESSGTILPEHFSCPKLFSKGQHSVLCSLPTIKEGTRKLPVCKTYECFRYGIQKTHQGIKPCSENSAPFRKYGYLNILESAGIDLL
jgi:hypothetical protein